jgi:signal peptidase II
VIDGFFRLTHARNPGAALGLFQQAPMWIFVALTAAALVLIGSFYRKLPQGDRFSASALGLILGGAIGNLIDRVRLGEVVDFLQFDLGLFIFPDFNFADSSIVIGVSLLLLEVVALEAEESVGPEARQKLGGG